jgi:hypothetical protein
MDVPGFASAEGSLRRTGNGLSSGRSGLLAYYGSRLFLTEFHQPFGMVDQVPPVVRRQPRPDRSQLAKIIGKRRKCAKIRPNIFGGCVF